MHFVYLQNTSGGEIAINPERVVLLEADGYETKVWCQATDDEDAGGNAIVVRGNLRQVAEDLSD